MSTTIDSLDIQITTSAGQSAQNIEKLAKALEQLRANAKLTTVTNNLNKLKTALDGLSGSSAGINNLKALSGIMRSLSAIPKLTSLNSALNALKKLPDIINGLDLATLEQFRKKMKKLAEALDPLASNISQVAAGFARLPQKIKSTVSAMNQLGAAQNSLNGHLNAGGLNLFTLTENFETLIGAVNGAIQAVSDFMAQAIEWDGIQFRFGRAFGEDADEVYQYVLKVNDVLGINIQEFMQYSSLYGSLLSGFGMAQDKVTTISVGLSELSYDIWAAYNDRFKSLESASEAVRSAITGEIEPIRNAGIALTEASMQEFLDNMGNAATTVNEVGEAVENTTTALEDMLDVDLTDTGLKQYLNDMGQINVSIERLTEAQKSEVRYAAMVNAAMNQGIIGTYAREMNTAEGAVRSLSQSFKTLTQALGSLFIPALQVVVPYVTAFVELLTEAVFWLAKLFGIPMQEISWDTASSGVGNLAEGAENAATGLGSAAKAAKKLRSYTMGFDELNIIDPPDASSGSGGGGAGGAGGYTDWGDGLDLSTIWDDSIFAQASRQVDELKGKIVGFWDEWKEEIAIIGTALGALSVAKLASSLGTALGLGNRFTSVIDNIAKVASTAIVITLQFTFMKEFFSDFMGDDGTLQDYIMALFVGGAGTWLLYSMWGPGGIVLGLGVTAAASLSAIIENGGVDSAESATVALTGLATAVGAVYGAWKLLKDTDIGAFFSLLREGEPIVGTLSAAFPGLSNTLASFGRTISGAATSVGAFLSGITAPVWATIALVIAAIASSAYFLYENWDKVKRAAQEFFDENIAPKLEEIKQHFDDMKDALGQVGEAFEPVVKAVTEFFDDIDWSKLDWIGSLFEGLGGIIFGAVSGVIAGAFNALMNIIQSMIKIFTGVVQTISGVIQLIVALFTKGDIGAAWSLIWTGIGNVLSGAVDLVFGTVANFVAGIINWFVELWDELVGHSIVPDMVEAIIEWFNNLVETVTDAIKEFVKSIIDKFTEFFTSIVTAVTDFVTKMIQKVKDTVSTIKKTVTDFIEMIIVSFKTMWNKIVHWWMKDVQPKLTLEYWKNKFDTVRSAIENKLEEVKKIASDKWEAIKQWFSTNVAPKLTLSYWEDKFSGLKEGFTTTIKNAINAGIDMMNKFIGWLNEKLHFEWDGLEIEGVEIFPGGSIQLFTIPKIPRLENGGFLEDGLFTMNRGEIAGKFNNGKSVVANNEQIVAGIAEGVYAAVVAAMNETQRGGGEQAVNVYLDGKQIYTSMKKTEARRGVNLMGNQVGYAY